MARDRLATLEVADDRAVAPIAPPLPSPANHENKPATATATPEKIGADGRSGKGLRSATAVRVAFLCSEILHAHCYWGEGTWKICELGRRWRALNILAVKEPNSSENDEICSIRTGPRQERRGVKKQAAAFLWIEAA